MSNMTKQRRRSKRAIFFVCSAVVNGGLVSESIEAEEKKAAEEKFEVAFQMRPSIVLGPFYRKRVISTINTADVVLSGDIKQAEYNGWIVRANLLKSPANFAFLLFDRRMDGKKAAKPQGTKIIPLENLKFRNQDDQTETKN